MKHSPAKYQVFKSHDTGGRRGPFAHYVYTDDYTQAVSEAEEYIKDGCQIVTITDTEFYKVLYNYTAKGY
jgi:hypothetical protein